jgi:hypothetical protein
MIDETTMPDKKNWIEIILMLTVIALVGIVGTAIIMNVEEKNRDKGSGRPSGETA